MSDAPTRPGTPPSPTRPRRRLTTASSGASGLLAGGLALLALAAVPVSGVVTEAFAEGDDTAAEGVQGTEETTTRPAARTIAGASNDRDARAEHLEVAEVTTASDDDAVETAPEPEPEPEPEDTPDEPVGEATKWDRLADCEAGDWDANGQPIPGTARWDYGLEFAHEGYEQFQGGLNFDPGTWDAFRDPDMPDHAGHATREQEIVVGERVLAAQGWGAWPVCSEKIGLR